MNRHVRVVAEKALRWTGLASLSRILHRDHVAVLAYHNIVPHGEPTVGDRSLHLEQHKFARQLDWIGRRYEVVPLTRIFDQQETRSRPRVAITFDDAYSGALAVGVKELVDRNMPATIFVAPAFVGGNPFWWDMLAVYPGGAPSTAIRDYCVRALDGRHDRILDWARESGIPIRSVPRHQTAATEEELTRCANSGSGKITFGSHTWSHPNLPHLRNLDEIENELRRPLGWLHARFEHVVPWLAYPYGLGTNATAIAAQQAGYHGAVIVSGGLTRETDLHARRFMLPRLNVPSGISLEGLALRCSGLVPYRSPEGLRHPD